MKLETYIKGSGEPLLLLGGAATDIDLYKPLLSLFATKYRVHFFNYPGFGKSTKFKKGHSLKSYMKVIEKFTRDHRMKDFHLAGISLGGYLAIRYAKIHNRSVRSLVLFAPMVKLRSKSLTKNAHKAAVNQRQVNKLPGKKYTQSVFRKRLLHGGRERVKQSKFAMSLRKIEVRDLPEIPTIVFLGKRDSLVDNAYARELFDAVNITPVELSPGRHMAHTVDSERVLKKMVSFTKSL